MAMQTREFMQINVVVMTHDVSEAVALSNRMPVIEDGRYRRRHRASLSRGSATLGGWILRPLLQSADEPSDL
jgi:ABC-type nitrate/sulfonate/bicarbonate transport system ATPase subunit